MEERCCSCNGKKARCSRCKCALVDYLSLTLVVIPLIYLKVSLQCSNPAVVLLTLTLLPPPHQHHLPLGLLGPPPNRSVFPLKKVPT